MSTDIRLEGIKRIKFAHRFSKLVIDFRQFLALDAVDLAMENRRLACEILRLIVFGERHIDILFLTRMDTNELILEARDEIAGADLQRIVLAFAAGKRDTIHFALEIERREVALFNSGVFRCIHHFRLVIGETINLLLDIFVRDIVHFFLNLEAFVIAELDLGTRHDRRFEHDVLAVLERDDVDLRARDDRLDVLFFHSGFDGIRREKFKRFLQDGVLADMRLDDLARRLALAEAGNFHLVCEAAASAALRLVEIGGRSLDRQDDLLVLYVFC